MQQKRLETGATEEESKEVVSRNLSELIKLIRAQANSLVGKKSKQLVDDQNLMEYTLCFSTIVNYTKNKSININDDYKHNGNNDGADSDSTSKYKIFEPTLTKNKLYNSRRYEMINTNIDYKRNDSDGKFTHEIFESNTNKLYDSTVSKVYVFVLCVLSANLNVRMFDVWVDVVDLIYKLD